MYWVKEKLADATRFLRTLYLNLSVPILFGYVLHLCLHRNVKIGVVELVLVILCVAEPIFVLSSKYFVTLKFGKDGFQVGFKQGTHTTDPITLCNDATFQDPPPPPESRKAEEETFESLSIESKMLLRTLWQNQKLRYGKTANDRWAFKQELFDEDKFHKGVSEQSETGRVSINKNGMVYLTDIGLSYCNRFDADVSGYPIHFGPPFPGWVK